MTLAWCKFLISLKATNSFLTQSEFIDWLNDMFLLVYSLVVANKQSSNLTTSGFSSK